MLITNVDTWFQGYGEKDMPALIISFAKMDKAENNVKSIIRLFSFTSLGITYSRVSTLVLNFTVFTIKRRLRCFGRINPHRFSPPTRTSNLTRNDIWQEAIVSFISKRAESEFKGFSFGAGFCQEIKSSRQRQKIRLIVQYSFAPSFVSYLKRFASTRMCWHTNDADVQLRAIWR